MMELLLILALSPMVLTVIAMFVIAIRNYKRRRKLLRRIREQRERDVEL